MSGTVNLPTRQTLLANLLLVKMAAFGRSLSTEFWVQRLDDAEHALDCQRWDPASARPDNPPPTRDELQLWRPLAESALEIADKLHRGLTSDSKWVRCCPQVVAYSYKLHERTRQILGHIDQLLLELDIMRACEKLPPEPKETEGRPPMVVRARKRSGKARKYHDDVLGKPTKDTMIN